MNEVAFNIFTKNKGVQMSANKVIYSLWVLSFGIAYFAHRFLGGGIVETIGKYIMVFAGVLAIYFLITQSFTRKPLNGTLNKKLIFKENEIQIDCEPYKIENIKKIEFCVDDYFNKWERPGRGDFNPSRTNGVNNFCELTQYGGQKIKVHFQMLYKDEFFKMKELLIHYYSKDKIHFLKLIDYLGINEYEDIQEFKKTLLTRTVT